MFDRKVLLRGASVALIAVTAPVALSTPRRLVAINDACAASEGRMTGQCCSAPWQYCEESHIWPCIYEILVWPTGALSARLDVAAVLD